MLAREPLFRFYLEDSVQYDISCGVVLFGHANLRIASRKLHMD